MSEPPVKSRARFQFELRHLLYATVLLAASLGLCGGWGIALALFVLLFWWDVFSKLRQSEAQAAQARADAENDAAEEEPPTSQSDSPDRSAFTLTELLVVIAIIAILIALLLPAVSGSPSWFRCSHNLSNLSRALEQYHLTHGSFPPAYLLDDTGSPAHSWRVLILPELGRQDLYDQYRFDEPWDGPHNQKLLERTPWEYQCHERQSVFGRHRPLEPGMTTYLAVTGQDAAWPGAAPRTLEELADSPDWTALVVEAEFQPVLWTKPEDFSIKEVSRLADPPHDIDLGHWNWGFLWSTFRGRQAIFADGGIHFLPPCKAAIMEELLTVTDGKPDKDATYLDAEPPDDWTRIHYTNIARLAFFFVAAAWPILWIRPAIRRHRRLHNDRSAFTLAELLAVILIVGVLWSLLFSIPAYRNRNRCPCLAGLLEASQALRMYQQNHGSLPPAYLADDAGRPAHSWRVLILPELGHQKLYDQYRFDEPWDSPHNRELLKEMPWQYQYHGWGTISGEPQRLESGMTTFLAVTGKDAAWSGATPRSLVELADSPDWVALVVDVEFQPVPWTKPEDFSIQEVSRLAAAPASVEAGHWRRGFLWSTFRGRCAIWANSHVDLLPPCDAASLEELLTLGDVKPGREAEYLDAGRPAAWRRAHHTNIARLTMFLVVAAWPIVWIRPTIRRHRRSAHVC